MNSNRVKECHLLPQHVTGSSPHPEKVEHGYESLYLGGCIRRTEGMSTGQASTEELGFAA